MCKDKRKNMPLYYYGLIHDGVCSFKILIHVMNLRKPKILNFPDRKKILQIADLGGSVSFGDLLQE